VRRTVADVSLSGVTDRTWRFTWADARSRSVTGALDGG
jgi:hypothetical protein